MLISMQKMDALSEIEDMLMRLEALLEEEKRHHEMLKNYLLTHSGSVEEVVEVDYKVKSKIFIARWICFNPLCSLRVIDRRLWMPD